MNSVFNEKVKGEVERTMFSQIFITLAVTAFAQAVVGDVAVSIGARPFQVSLRSANVHFCSGSLIAGRWAVTAAHCVAGITSLPIQVVTGTVTLNSGGTVYNSSQFYVPSGYVPQQKAYDIALVETTENIDLNANVGLINIPFAFTGSGITATVSGWGKSSSTGLRSNQLRSLAATTIYNDDCNVAGVTAALMCTYAQVGERFCFGDDGGPLIVNGALVGIALSDNTCEVGSPDVFTRVNYHRSWIFKTVNIIP